jgi:hypothetical protein
MISNNFYFGQPVYYESPFNYWLPARVSGGVPGSDYLTITINDDPNNQMTVEIDDIFPISRETYELAREVQKLSLEDLNRWKREVFDKWSHS